MAATLIACGAAGAAENSPKRPVGALHPDFFPVTTQFSPVPDGPGWKGETGALSAQVLRDTINNLRAHGFTGLYHPLPLPEEQARVALAYAQSRGMVITHITSGFEGFGRDAPPGVCVYSPKYAAQARQAIQSGLAGLADLPRLYNVFCYQDEPFHAGAKSFGYNEEVKAEFQKRYGYPLPPALEPIRNEPRVWRDVLNFRSDSSPTAGGRFTASSSKSTPASRSSSPTTATTPSAAASALTRDWRWTTCSTGAAISRTRSCSTSTHT